MSAPVVAVLDACVLYPPALRDLLLWLASEFVYAARWTEDIHREWMRSVQRDRPDIPREKLERTRQLMDDIHEECLVIDYERHINDVILPDQADRHVLAAAMTAEASVIVTFNLSDFPESALAPHGLQAVHPDTFLCQLLAADDTGFVRAVAKHRGSLNDPPKTMPEYMATLRRNRLTAIASRLEELGAS